MATKHVRKVGDFWEYGYTIPTNLDEWESIIRDRMLLLWNTLPKKEEKTLRKEDLREGMRVRCIHTYSDSWADRCDEGEEYTLHLSTSKN